MQSRHELGVTIVSHDFDAIKAGVKLKMQETDKSVPIAKLLVCLSMLAHQRSAHVCKANTYDLPFFISITCEGPIIPAAVENAWSGHQSSNQTVRSRTYTASDDTGSCTYQELPN